MAPEYHRNMQLSSSGDTTKPRKRGHSRILEYSKVIGCHNTGCCNAECHNTVSLYRLSQYRCHNTACYNKACYNTECHNTVCHNKGVTLLRQLVYTISVYDNWKPQVYSTK